MKLAKLTVLACAIAAFAPACSVEKTQEGKMPDVDVKGGQVPKYDVDVADVDVNKTTATVTVPDVDVKTEQKTVTVPNVDVKMPNESNATPAPAQ